VAREDVEIVREIYAAAARHDGETPFRYYAPDIEWDVSGVGGVVLGDVFRGHDGVRRFWQNWLMGFESIELVPEELIDLEPHVLARIHERGRGRSSGAVIDRYHWAVWTMREGKVVSMRAYVDRAKALEAVELTD
jgi:ketosteroid isomerase-like protein